MVLNTKNKILIIVIQLKSVHITKRVISSTCTQQWYFNILGIHFANIRCCFVGQPSDKISGCQEQHLLKGYMHKISEQVYLHYIVK